MIFTRRDRRVITTAKTSADLRDEIVDTRLCQMTPQEMRAELAERLYAELEAMTAAQLRDECDYWEVDRFRVQED